MTGEEYYYQFLTKRGRTMVLKTKRIKPFEKNWEEYEEPNAQAILGIYLQLYGSHRPNFVLCDTKKKVDYDVYRINSAEMKNVNKILEE